MPPRRFDVEWSQAAFVDLSAILEFIAADRPGTAPAVLDRVERAAAALDRNPNRGRIVAELAAHGMDSYREIVVFPWRVIYEIQGSKVAVLMVVDSRRNLQELLIERVLGKR